MSQDEVIWLHEYRRPGILLSMGAFYSLVVFQDGDEQIVKLVENNDYDFWSERQLDNNE